jgi:hypothetical protein
MCDLRTSVGRLLLALVGLCGSTAYADCPHCYRIVKVRAEFHDGSARVAYFEQHDEITPAIPGPDGVTYIQLGTDPFSREPIDSVVLIDSIYNFEGITFATSPQHLMRVATAHIEHLILVDGTPYQAAGTINVYSRERLRLLGRPAVATYGLNGSGLDWVVYVSHNSALTDSVLASLARFLVHGYWHMSDARIRFFEAAAGRRAQTWEAWQQSVRSAGWRATDSLMKYRALIEELQGVAALRPLLEPLARHAKLLIRATHALLEYAEAEDIPTFRREILDIALEKADTAGFAALPWDEPLTANLEKLKPLVRWFDVRLSPPRPPSEEQLEQIGVLVARTYYD